MLVKLYDLPEVSSRINELGREGIIIRRPNAYERHLVLGWVEREFGLGWTSECAVAFTQRPIPCFIATKNRQIDGFACFDCTRLNFFGPIGVSQTRRSHGIGRILLLTCLHAMQERGYAYAIIGAAGCPQFFSKAAGATEIAGSEPGIYRDRLSDRTQEDK